MAILKGFKPFFDHFSTHLKDSQIGAKKEPKPRSKLSIYELFFWSPIFGSAQRIC